MKEPGPIKKRLILWVWNNTPNCAEMCRMSSRSLESRPSLSNRMRMWLHHLICVWCKRYQQQLNFLHRHAPDLPHHSGAAMQKGLSKEARGRIVKSIRQAISSQ